MRRIEDTADIVAGRRAECSQDVVKYVFQSALTKTLFWISIMPIITLDMPDAALSALRRSPNEFVREMRLAASMHWYARGMISQEKAAEIAGLDRTDFLLSLAREQVPSFMVDLEQLREELSRG